MKILRRGAIRPLLRPQEVLQDLDRYPIEQTVMFDQVPRGPRIKSGVTVLNVLYSIEQAAADGEAPHGPRTESRATTPNVIPDMIRYPMEQAAVGDQAPHRPRV